MFELRFIKIDDTVRLQHRDGYKVVNGEMTTESNWIDVPLHDLNTDKIYPIFNLKNIKDDYATNDNIY